MAVAETQAPQLVRGVDDIEKPRRRKRAKTKGKGKRDRTRDGAVRFTTRELLREANVERKGSAYEATIVREGPGNTRDGNAYSAEALRQAVDDGLFESLQCYANHPTPTEERERPERDVRQLVGHFREARFVPGSPAEVRARFVPITGPGYEWVTSLIESALQSATDKPLVGISIDGYGHAPDTAEIDGRTYNVVRRITGLGSADIVTKAGAGGQFVKRLQESMRGAEAANDKRATVALPKLQKRLRKAVERLETAIGDEDEDNVRDAVVVIREASSALVELPATEPPGPAADQAAEVALLREQVGEEQRRRKVAEAKAAKAGGQAQQAKRARQASTLLREAQVPDGIARLWFDELASCSSKREMVSLLERRQAQRRDELVELRESAGFDLRIEGAGRRLPPQLSGPPQADLLDRLGIEHDYLEN